MQSTICLVMLSVLMASDSTAFRLKWSRQDSSGLQWLLYPFRRLPTNPQTTMTTAEIITSQGYPVEIHSVTTDDGYILELQRIPYSNKVGNQGGKKKPVYLQHGVADSSAIFVTNPNTDGCLAYLLADMGYDVWLGNSRGTTYSRKHVSLDPSKAPYWNFTVDDMGNHDIPASINYVLSSTGQDKLVYIGHSLGGAIFFIAMIQHPELNAKIDVMIGLAPASSIAHTRNYYTYIFRNFNLIKPYLTATNTFVVNTNEGIGRQLQRLTCEQTYFQAAICREYIFATFGSDSNNFKLEQVPVFNGHWPTGTSAKVLEQFAQNYNAGELLQAFDYGPSENQKQYGTTKPLVYDLKKVTAPVHVFWAENDYAVAPKDVAWLITQLGNLQSSTKIDDPNYNHLDFLLAPTAKTLVYDHIFPLLPPPT